MKNSVLVQGFIAIYMSIKQIFYNDGDDDDNTPPPLQTSLCV